MRPSTSLEASSNFLHLSSVKRLDKFLNSDQMSYYCDDFYTTTAVYHHQHFSTSYTHDFLSEKEIIITFIIGLDYKLEIVQFVFTIKAWDFFLYILPFFTI